MHYRFLALISIFFLCSATVSVFGQWTNYKVLDVRTDYPPALAVFEDRLYLAWTDLSFKVNVLSSTNGFDYENKVQFRQTAATGAPSMAVSEHCRALYMAYPTGGGLAMTKASHTPDGIGWESPKVSSGFKPAGSVTLVDGFIAGPESPTNLPRFLSYDCDLNLKTDSNCLLPVPKCNIRASGALAWARVGSTDLRAMTRGDNREIIYSLNGRSLTNLNLGGGKEWSRKGPVAAIDPDRKDPYILWTGRNDQFNLANLKSGRKLMLSDHSSRTPAVAVFSGQIFVAWRGGREGKIVVASLPLFPNTNPDFEIGISPSQQTKEPGEPAIYTVSVQGLNGFSSPVRLSLSEIPHGFSTDFDRSSLLPGESATLAVRSPGYENAQFGAFDIKMEGSAENLTRDALAILTVVNLRPPGSMCFDPAFGYAGIGSYTVTIDRGASMRLDLRFVVKDIKTGEESGIMEVLRWPEDGLDSRGQKKVALGRDLPVGHFIFRSFKNALVPNADWIGVPQNDNCGKFTLYWPKPTSLEINTREVKVGGRYKIKVGNAANLRLDAIRSFNGAETTLMLPQANNEGEIEVNVPCDTPEGTYKFIAIKNSEDACGDKPCSGQSAWFFTDSDKNSIDVRGKESQCRAQ